jgi:hypothetical protein
VSRSDPSRSYLGPLFFHNTLASWIFGKLISDLAFYIRAIFSYERFQRLVTRRQPRAEGVTDESVATIGAA